MHPRAAWKDNILRNTQGIRVWGKGFGKGRNVSHKQARSPRFRNNNPKFLQPRILHAIKTRVSHIIWYHADHHEQWKRVPYQVFFVKDWRSRRKCVPTNHRPWKVKNSQVCRRKKKKKKKILKESLPGAPRHGCIKLSANIRRIDCAGPILSHS